MWRPDLVCPHVGESVRRRVAWFMSNASINADNRSHHHLPVSYKMDVDIASDDDRTRLKNEHSKDFPRFFVEEEPTWPSVTVA